MAKDRPLCYGAVAKTLHWGLAALIIFMLGLGLYMGGVEELTAKLKLYNLHKALGVTILGLALVRVAWRLFARYPAAEESLTTFEKAAAGGMHFGLYLWMLGLPLSGWLMSSAAGRPVSFFGLFTLPDLVGADKEWSYALHEVHEVLAWSLMALAGLHALAALKHHFIDKDKVLRRMLPFAKVE